MTHFTRRSALRGLSAAGIAASVAGCVGAPLGNGRDDTDGGADENGSTGDGTGDDGNGDGRDDDDTGADDGTPGELRTEIQHAVPKHRSLGWSYDERVGICVLVSDPTEAGWLVDDDDDAAAEFVSGTDFESAVLLYVESVGPTTCYRELEFGECTIQNDTISVGAEAVDDAAGGDVCGEALTFPGAFVRASADRLPNAATVTLTNGWGETETVESSDPLLDPASLPGAIEPDGDPQTVPSSVVCPDDDFERHPPGYADQDAVSWGSAPGVDGTPGLELRILGPHETVETTGADDTDNGDDSDGTVTYGWSGEEGTPRVERGETVRFVLRNVAKTYLGVGNRGTYNLEVYTEAGWTEVRGTEEGVQLAYTEELQLLAPGESITWTFTMTEAGLVDGGPHEDLLRVCPDLVPGRYRFVFWGGNDVAVAFEYDG